MSLKDFEIIQKLGEGAFSNVFKVRNKKSGEILALKKVRLGNLGAREKENALNEVRILASISHEGIVAYKEAFIDEESRTLCVAMEFAEGGDLLMKINKHKQQRSFFEEDEIWNCLLQVTMGLKALHDMKIMHRDLKCANIFITKDGNYKLADLNVSKVMKTMMAHTQTGTPYYASPEVWKDNPYTYSSDIWSLGCVIYEMTTKSPPFTARDMQGLYRKVIQGAYPPIPPRYSNDLSNVIKSLLQVNPKMRPTCEKILQMPPIQRHIQMQSYSSANSSNKLLGTIKYAPSAKILNGRLPKRSHSRENLSSAGRDNQETLSRRGRDILSAGPDRTRDKFSDRTRHHHKDLKKAEEEKRALPPRPRLPPNRPDSRELHRAHKRDQPSYRQNPVLQQRQPSERNPTHSRNDSKKILDRNVENHNRPYQQSPSDRNINRAAANMILNSPKAGLPKPFAAGPRLADKYNNARQPRRYQPVRPVWWG